MYGIKIIGKESDIAKMKVGDESKRMKTMPKVEFLTNKQ